MKKAEVSRKGKEPEAKATRLVKKRGYQGRKDTEEEELMAARWMKYRGRRVGVEITKQRFEEAREYIKQLPKEERTNARLVRLFGFSRHSIAKVYAGMERPAERRRIDTPPLIAIERSKGIDVRRCWMQANFGTSAKKADELLRIEGTEGLAEAFPNGLLLRGTLLPLDQVVGLISRKIQRNGTYTEFHFGLEFNIQPSTAKLLFEEAAPRDGREFDEVEAGDGDGHEVKEEEPSHDGYDEENAHNRVDDEKVQLDCEDDCEGEDR